MGVKKHLTAERDIKSLQTIKGGGAPWRHKNIRSDILTPTLKKTFSEEYSCENMKKPLKIGREGITQPSYVPHNGSKHKKFQLVQKGKKNH